MLIWTCGHNMGPTPPLPESGCRKCGSNMVIFNRYGQRTRCISCGEDHSIPPCKSQGSSCECGTDKTYKNPNPHFHSDYCPKYKKKEE